MKKRKKKIQKKNQNQIQTTGAKLDTSKAKQKKGYY